ncbi:MAG: hypothetical protein HYS07_04525, partial [Chlamydiae bacterium]|nr:hypothetical protein [Chlamydiota bacterium]
MSNKDPHDTDEIFAYMNTHVEKDHPSISGFPGKLWAPFLPLDIDAVDLEKALDAARVIAKTLIQEWKVPGEACHFYFSGSKGFHILLDIRLFGRVLANQHLHQIFSTLRENLMYELPLFDHALVDLTIKDAVRLLRLANTLHEKSKLYKIPLSVEEILSNTISEFLCPAFLKMYENSVEPGLRNNSVIRLLSEFRLHGLSLEKSRELILAWNEKNKIGLLQRELEHV